MSDKVTEIFGLNVFSDEVMRERLPKNIYKAFQKVLAGECELEPAVADVVAKRYEALGGREGGDSLLPLVPADDGFDG